MNQLLTCELCVDSFYPIIILGLHNVRIGATYLWGDMTSFLEGIATANT